MMNNFKKVWRDSATLIVVVKNQLKSDWNYNLLTFKRTEKTSFMQNSVVFPGGATDKYDEVKEWINLYKNLGITDEKFKEITEIKGNRPFIFQQQKQSDNIEREISLRISAARETFEELGVLICKTKEQFNCKSIFSNYYNKFDIPKWQNLVHNDASEFLKLCCEHKIAPDLWNLHEWSDWLTPSTFDRRFETAFFIVALEDCPEIYPEPNEVADYKIINPNELLLAHFNSDIWLPPPQLYELCRLRAFNKCDDLIKFSKERNNKGTTLFYPISYQLKDRYCQILPGDDFYPKNPNYVSQSDFEMYKEKSADEFRAGIKNLHRVEIKSIGKYKLYMNINPLDGHVKPNSELFVNKL